MDCDIRIMFSSRLEIKKNSLIETKKTRLVVLAAACDISIPQGDGSFIKTCDAP